MLRGVLMRVKFEVQKKFSVALDLKRIAIERGNTRAVRESVNTVKQRLRGQTIGSGLGRRVANAWRSKMYPDRKSSAANPAGIVYTRAQKIIDGFSRGTPIKSKDGFFLAVATELAPKRGNDGKRISPSNFPEWKYGRLEFVYRQTGPSFLIVRDSGITKSGRASRKRKNGSRVKSGAYRKGTADVIMFLLYPQVRLRKVFDLDREARLANVLLHRKVRLQLERLQYDNQ
ncbi:DUF6441 family protein [Thalassospira xiamenensis]|uniref:DUF6441 family protein n=1 Tax=Thalassospira xiamenensis TaxID=220697 RepID=UPI0015EFEE66|nr:DUF6441 family protein [Thalassospira xiamenensis]